MHWAFLKQFEHLLLTGLIAAYSGPAFLSPLLLHHPLLAWEPVCSRFVSSHAHRSLFLYHRCCWYCIWLDGLRTELNPFSGFTSQIKSLITRKCWKRVQVANTRWAGMLIRTSKHR
ncbi:hypothetical protein BJX70DRAFT_321227 [Aspergillus crustosus]